MKITLIAFLFLSAVMPLSAEPLRGQDILGLAKQDVPMIASTIEQGTAIGVLAGTFGPVISPLEKLLKTGKVPAFRAHLLNGSCWRMNRCESGEPSLTNYKILAKRAKYFSDLQKENPNVQCFISPVLEHDEKNQAIVNKWFDTIRISAPNCRPVCSNVSGWCPRGILHEVHGNEARGDIASNDGASLYDSNSPEYRNHGSVITLGWIDRFNLRVSGEKTFTFPKKRTFKASKVDIIQVQRLLKPEAPKPQTACREVKAPEILKTNAEEYGGTDVRENKPLLISKAKNTRLNVLTVSGKAIGFFRLYGSYGGHPGYNRHYIGSGSGQNPVQLMDQLGSEWGILKTPKECILFNSIRRKGLYH